MRYLGNKTKLLPFIENVINKYDIDGEIFADLFSGTGAVGDYFKDKYQIYSNDFMYYSYVFSKAKLMNNSIPQFRKFEKLFKTNPFEYLNKKKYQPTEQYFIYNNYSPKADRLFFTPENAIKIDGMRIDIEDLYQSEIISEAEYFFLLASLLESVTKVSNTSGTYEAFFKFWESRSNKPFVLESLEMNQSYSVDNNNMVFNEDTNFLVRYIKGDIAYIDTPYTVTQYSSAYHILETIAKYDSPEIGGKTGRRKRNRRMSEYSRRQKAKEAFEDLFRQLQFKHILVSYSNQSLVPLEELVNLASLFAVNNEVFVEKLPYREYKNLNSSKKQKGENLKEIILYFRKDNGVIKSPLNYSGSKDSLVKQINRELPSHVGVFVDAMGGAFNVGTNITATEKVVYNEYNSYVFPIIEMLLKEDKNKLILEIEKVIDYYKLDKGKKEEYMNFRKIYNNNDKSSLNLFILHMFSFQNLIRFNSKFEFNTPIGNAGYNDGIRERIINFNVRSPHIEFYKGSYNELDLNSFPKGTVFYFDPPYLITTAEYNDGKRGFVGWNSEEEIKLLEFLDLIDNKGCYFMLSNVVEHQGKINNLLKEWIEYNNYNVVQIGKTGTRYPRNEVLIKNFE